MKRRIEIIPTFILLIILVCSLIQRSLGQGWENLFVIGLTGLCVYAPVIVFIDGITISFRYPKPLPKTDKMFFTYMISLATVSIAWAIYLMGHN